jgi:DNA invertase Pin-like site-specific DNA recombinase
VRRLYVYRLDRLARSGIRVTFEVVDELKRHGCELITVSDGFSLEGPAAEVVLAVLSWAVKMERLAINERISAARDRLIAEGRSWGRPSRFTSRDRERISALRRQGRSLREIAVALKIPCSSVRYALGRKVGAPGPASNAGLALPKRAPCGKQAFGTK